MPGSPHITSRPAPDFITAPTQARGTPTFQTAPILALMQRTWDTMVRVEYLVGDFRTSFVYTVTPTVSGDTVVDGALPGSTRRGPPFSTTKISREVALSSSEKERGASDLFYHREGGPTPGGRRGRNPGA